MIYHPTMHSASRHRDGSVFGRKHNDRQGEANPDTCNVDPSLSTNNIYYNIVDGEWYNHDDACDYMTFKDAEDTYIKERLHDAWEAQQSRYRAHRQYNRCNDLDTWYEAGRRSGSITVDQQTIQLGNFNDGCVDKDTLKDIVVDYLKESEAYNKVHDIECVTLSVAIHCDEIIDGIITIHAHQNRIFFAKDKNGITISGQEKALRQSDLLPPDASAEYNRHNNIKMTFTKDHREIYCNVCEAHGIEIDRTPISGGNKRHMEQDCYITQQNRRKKQENKELTEDNEKLVEDNKQAQQEYDAMRLQIQMLQQQLDATQHKNEELTEENDNLAKEINQSQERINAMNNACDNVREKLTSAEHTVFKFGQQMARKYEHEWQQFLDEEFGPDESASVTNEDSIKY